MDQDLAPLKAGKAHGSSHGRKSGLGKLKAQFWMARWEDVEA